MEIKLTQLNKKLGHSNFSHLNKQNCEFTKIFTFERNEKLDFLKIEIWLNKLYLPYKTEWPVKNVKVFVFRDEFILPHIQTLIIYKNQ